MPIDIQSTTDSKEAVTAALGDLAKPDQVDENTAAPAAKAGKSASEASAAGTSEEVSEENEDIEASSEGEETESEAPKKKAGGFQKRIDKLTKRVATEAQEKEYWREQALKSQAQQNPAKTEPDKAAKAESVEGKPKADDFESHADYLEALTDWKVDQRDKAREIQAKEAQVKTEHQKAIEAHQAKVQSFKEAHADFDDVLEDVNDVPMSITVQQAILSADNSAELMYQLAKHKDEYKRICALPPIAAAKELGKFEVKYLKASSDETPTPTTTKAPKPVSPVRGGKGSSVRKSIDDPNLSQREYERLREEQIAAADRG